jgi:hypothetical protein
MSSAITQLSPGVGVNEIDMTTSLPAISTSGGGYVGDFMWGPVDERTTLSDSGTLEATFWKPTDSNYIDWFSVFNFLAYTSNAEVVRVVDTVARNASDAVPQRIFNANHFRMNVSVGTPTATFAARYPGSLGNSLRVSLADANTFTTWEYADLFDTAPGTSTIASQLGAVNDELHIVVVDLLGQFSGVPGSVLEKYAYVSKASDAKDANGAMSYYVDQLNAFSAYVWAMKPSTNATMASLAPAGNGGGAVTLAVATGGSGYAQGAAVTVASPNAGGSGFAGTAVVKNGVITAITVSAPGTGYTSAGVSVTGAGSGFVGTVTVAAGAVTGVVVANGGSGYAPGTVVSFSGPGTGADATATLTDGILTGVTVVSPGVGYTNGTPAIAGTGTGATFVMTTSPVVQTVAWGSKMVILGVPSAFTQLTTVGVVTLAGGLDSVAVTAVERIHGYDFFSNADQSDVGLLFTGNGGGATHNKIVIQHLIDNVSEVRKDCLTFCSPNLSDIQGKTESQATAAVKAFRVAVGRSSSYAIMDSGWKVQYDVYNNKYRVVPLNADIAGLCAQVDATNDPWWSPGGYNRGRVKNIVSLIYSPGKTSRDALYKDGVNPVTTFGVDGTILMGDKTLQGKQSAFSYIGIRRLFIVLRKMVANGAKYTLFDFNTPYTRANFVNMVEPRLRDVKGRNGMNDFYLQCDERNNGDEIVQRGEFVASIFIKPMYSIQWVSLNFIAIRREVSFDEVAGITF